MWDLRGAPRVFAAPSTFPYAIVRKVECSLPCTDFATQEHITCPEKATVNKTV